MSARAAGLIEVRLKDLAQLFNLMDPSPFRDRDLDAAAEEFIVEWARELPKTVSLELVIHVVTPPAPERAAGLEDAVQNYFQTRRQTQLRSLRRVTRLNGIGFVLGLAFLGTCVAASELIAHTQWTGAWVGTLASSLDIIGWVALWRPVEGFLYERWPLRQNIRLYDRLARMKVTLIVPTSV